MKIWFQNRRTKWKKSENISDTQVAQIRSAAAKKPAPAQLYDTPAHPHTDPKAQLSNGSLAWSMVHGEVQLNMGLSNGSLLASQPDEIKSAVEMHNEAMTISSINEQIIASSDVQAVPMRTLQSPVHAAPSSDTQRAGGTSRQLDAASCASDVDQSGHHQAAPALLSQTALGAVDTRSDKSDIGHSHLNNNPEVRHETGNACVREDIDQMC